MERIKIDDGSRTYEIVNQDDVVLGTFTFNPSDANIIKRYDAVVDELGRYAEQDFVMTQDKFVEIQSELVSKMNDLVGADTESTFFSICGALSPMANGKLFIQVVLEAIGAVIEKETKKRMKKVDAQVSKYLEGYK